MISSKYFIPFKKSGGAIVDWDFTNPIHCLNWYKKTDGYATSNIPLGDGKKTLTLMHRIIMGFPKEVDHINGNKLDNRQENLRSVTRRQNKQNLKCHRDGKLVGAQYDKRCNKWYAIARINGKPTNLGTFNTEEEAHNKYMEMIQNEVHQ